MDFLTLPLSKVDLERRLVYGRAAACVPDRSGEIMDWDSGRDAIKNWSDSFENATGGMSRGNIRVQHDAKQIAGKVVDIDFKDDDKAVDIVVKVVDDNAWRLVKEGCVSGFSIGGSYAKKWTDTESGLTKYTPKIAEISLVDRPCIPDAKITMFKADGFQQEVEVQYGQLAKLSKSTPRTFAQIPSRPRTFSEIEGS